MSAIWGNINFKNESDNTVNHKIVDYYNSNCKIDHIHSIAEKTFFFGCGIQNITAEAASEKLPYYSPDKRYCLTADAILDNRVELMGKLNVSDNNMPDGALLCCAYEKWGINLVKHIRGLFSIAIYEPGANTAYLISDHVSGRCLYYYYDNACISFSTLAGPLRFIHSDININDMYIKDFLTAPGLMPNIVSDETPYKNVHMLNPGTYLKITSESIEEISYWTPAAPINYSCSSPEEYSTYFRTLYEQCVNDALRTDGNIGIAMSSGLDSATVGTIAAKILANNDGKLYSYTYVPFEEPAADRNRNNVHNETEAVKMIHKMYPNIVGEFLNNNGKSCFDDIAQGVKVLEIPFKACVNMPNLFEIYRKASSNACKVVLCGQMGNSTVSHGYIDDVLFDLFLHKKYITFLRYLNNYSKTVKESRKEALKGCIRYFRHAKKEYSNHTFSYVPGNAFLADNILDGYSLSERYTKAGTPVLGGVPTPGHIYRKYLYLPAMFTYLGVLETKVGLAFGIVLRDPTKDMRMLNFCYHLPYHLFAYKGTPRWLIRSGCRDLLPHSILDNWMRYGVQNSDFMARIIRDWDTVATKISAELLSSTLKDYINQRDVKEFLAKGTPTLGDSSHVTDILFFDVLYHFLINNKI